MASHPPRKELSLRALELFQATAAKGSLQAVARDEGLALSTVSHHLRGLEAHLGAPLFVDGRRPMVLTPTGAAFLRDITQPIAALRRASAEASAGDGSETRYLRLGSIEDFDRDVIPALAVHLAKAMPHCSLSFRTESSHRIIELLHQRQLELGITTTHTEKLGDLQARPLLRDPFVLVMPAGLQATPAALAQGDAALPFLRFTENLIIARQIESQLKRSSLAPAHGFSCSNNQTLMAMVAAGAGWTITTALLFSHATGLADGLAMHPFPGAPFARTLSLLATPDCASGTRERVERETRRLIAAHSLTPLTVRAPWLRDAFKLVG